MQLTQLIKENFHLIWKSELEKDIIFKKNIIELIKIKFSSQQSKFLSGFIKQAVIEDLFSKSKNFPDFFKYKYNTLSDIDDLFSLYINFFSNLSIFSFHNLEERLLENYIHEKSKVIFS